MAQNGQQAESGLADLESGAGNPKMSKSQKRLLACLIAVVCLVVAAVYWPALSAKAISFDDERYFVANPLVRNPSLKSAWSFVSELMPSTVGGYYQPLTMISLMLDYVIATPGDDLRSFHRTSLALHVANTGLIIVLLYLLFGKIWVAAAVGLIFGVHPLTVEPIPWIGERKTLLAAFFTFLSLLFYLSYVRGGKRKFFLWSLGMYFLALLSKPTSTPLPVMMLLIDYWPLRRLKWSKVWEKAPFFVVGGISGVITYISQERTASILTPGMYGLMRVPLVICHNIIFYLWKMLWPFNLTSHYPFPKPLDFSQPMVAAGVIGSCVLIGLLLISLRRTRAAMTGWLIFFIMVLPTMQALQFSDVIASDKFVYLPAFGILMILAAFFGWVSSGRTETAALTGRRVALTIVILAAVCGEVVATRQYLSCWRDSVSLWSHMAEVVPMAAPPRNNYGVALAEAGNMDAAMEQFQKVLEIDPNDSDGSYNVGNVLSRKGQLAEALQYYEKALKQRPDEGNIYQAIGVVLNNQGRPEEAIELFYKALRHKKMGQAYLLHDGLGSLFLQLGRVDEAIAELERATEQWANSGSYMNLGLAMASKGQQMASKGQRDEAVEYYNEAVECYKKAIRLNPNNAEALYNLGNAYLSLDRTDQAIAEYKMALQIKPNYIKAYGNLAVALASVGYIDEATENFRRVCELDPNNSNAYFNLSRALADKGLTDEAIENLRKTIELAPQDTAARNNLAKLLLEKGKAEQAIAEYEQILKIDPANKDAQTGLQKARDAQAKGAPPNP